MYGNTHEALRPQQGPGNRWREAVASQMNADSFHRHYNIDPIVDEKLGTARNREGLHLTRKRHKFRGREIAFAKLDRR
jgi:hypothetical protein